MSVEQIVCSGHYYYYDWIIYFIHHRYHELFLAIWWRPRPEWLSCHRWCSSLRQPKYRQVIGNFCLSNPQNLNYLFFPSIPRFNGNFLLYCRCPISNRKYSQFKQTNSFFLSRTSILNLHSQTTNNTVVMQFSSCKTFFVNQDFVPLVYCRTDWVT